MHSGARDVSKMSGRARDATGGARGRMRPIAYNGGPADEDNWRDAMRTGGLVRAWDCELDFNCSVERYG